MASTELVIALDYPDSKTALSLVDRIGESATWYKVGNQLFSSAGPALVKTLVSQGKKVFLDLKFHDIPNTVYSATKACSELGVSLLTVHLSGGREMLEAATKAVAESKGGTQILGVTVLTSLGNENLKEIGVENTLQNQVLQLAQLAQETNINGLVCSVHEVAALRKKSQAFKFLTPGIRLADSGSSDQKRVATPQMALKEKVNWIVVGRPITQSSDPENSCQKFLEVIHVTE